MTLMQAHRVLIASAVLLFVLYGGLALTGRLPGGTRARLVQGGLSLLAAAGLGAYLWSLGGRGRSR